MSILGHRVVGSGPQRLIVLHDWMGDHRNYETMLPYLGKQFSVGLVDLRGYGLSRSLSGAYNLSEAAADVCAVADELGWASFHLLGHSMSSLIVQQVAASAPERIEKLVLLTPIPPEGLTVPEAIVEYLHELALDPRLRQATIGKQWGDRLSSAWVDFKLERWSECAEPVAVKGYADMYTSERVSVPPSRDIPTLAVVGEYDQEPFSEQTVRSALGAVYDNLELFVCKNSGHYPMQETPVVLASALERFLSG